MAINDRTGSEFVASVLRLMGLDPKTEMVTGIVIRAMNDSAMTVEIHRFAKKEEIANLTALFDVANRKEPLSRPMTKTEVITHLGPVPEDIPWRTFVPGHVGDPPATPIRVTIPTADQVRRELGLPEPGEFS